MRNRLSISIGDGVGRHALDERVEVLLGENGGRDEHGDLLAVHDGFERGAHRDLGLAVADVAADQAVHRPPAFHVPLGVEDRLVLVGGFLVGERGLELVLPGRVLRKRVPAEGLAPGVGFEERRGQVAHGVLGRQLFAGPPLAAERVQVGPAPADPDVAAQQVRLRDRHVELGLFRVLDGEHLLLLSVEFDLIQAEVLADAVVHVNDQFAGLDVGPLGDPRAGRLARAVPFSMEFVATGKDFPEAVQVGLGDDRQLERFGDEAFGERA